MAGEAVQKLVGRHKRLSFMEVSDGKYVRMTKFTSLGDSKDAKEYSRQYVDEESETSDVVGYASGVSYELDRHTNNEVHDKIAQITDNEVTGPDARVNIVTVDTFEPVSEADPKTCKARLRTYSVIPDSSGDGTDSLAYSGTFKAAGGITEGTATATEDWKTAKEVTFEKKQTGQ